MSAEFRSPDFVPATFRRRTAAFMIEILPITAVVAAIFYFGFGFDQALEQRFAHPGDIEIRKAFLEQRNFIRNIAGAVWVLYSIVCEVFWQAAVGKRLLGLRVVDGRGGRPTFKQTLGRNFSKLLSVLPLFLGCLWALFDDNRQAWHDKLAGTYVVRRHPRPGESPDRRWQSSLRE